YRQKALPIPTLRSFPISLNGHYAYPPGLLPEIAREFITTRKQQAILFANKFPLPSTSQCFDRNKSQKTRKQKTQHLCWVLCLERHTRFELVTSTLARLRSTN